MLDNTVFSSPAYFHPTHRHSIRPKNQPLCPRHLFRYPPNFLLEKRNDSISSNGTFDRTGKMVSNLLYTIT